MLALGVPKGIVNVFILMYKGLHKHLSYRGWISKQSVTNANGVAQGCSFSLLAINAYMHIWATFIEHIPHVVSRVFIDDAYLWVHINHVNDLARALQMTEQWGVVVGQKLNHSKSVLWATSGNARQIAKKNFPSLPLFLEFDVLGAKCIRQTGSTSSLTNRSCTKLLPIYATLPTFLFLDKPKNFWLAVRFSLRFLLLRKSQRFQNEH